MLERSTQAPPHGLLDLKDLLLTAWCQLGGLVESRPRLVRAVLLAQGEPTQCREGAFNLYLNV